MHERANKEVVAYNGPKRVRVVQRGISRHEVHRTRGFSGILRGGQREPNFGGDERVKWRKGKR
jgi:hypothetical protein